LIRADALNSADRACARRIKTSNSEKRPWILGPYGCPG
jgi:hypothetical protein